MLIKSWDIKIKEDSETVLKLLLQEFCNINESTKIFFWLDLNKKEYTVFEKILYDIVVFHFKRLGLDLNDTNYFVECWTHYRFSSDYKLHIDVDESEFKREKLYLPLITTLTYFNDIKNPTFLIDVTEEQYSNNDYKNHDAYFVFPKMLKHIAFEGNKYYHGAVNLFNEPESNNGRYIVGMNIWKRPLEFVKKYDFNMYDRLNFKYKSLYYIDKTYKLFDFEENNKVKMINTDNTIMDCIIPFKDENMVKFRINNIKKNNGEDKKYFTKLIFLDDKLFVKEFSNLIKEADLSSNDMFKIFI